ncbi:hypothetical protein, partial [Aequorivita antarctica]|uniref:hypothetical protein n=1 Tax=Aequorivita antarctica TaxID=153266 RepID=UPI001F237088
SLVSLLTNYLSVINLRCQFQYLNELFFVKNKDSIVGGTELNRCYHFLFTIFKTVPISLSGCKYTTSLFNKPNLI